MTEEFENTAETETKAETEIVDEAPAEEIAVEAGDKEEIIEEEPSEEIPAEETAVEVNEQEESSAQAESIKSDPRDELDFPLESIIEALLIAAPEPRTARQLATSAGKKIKPKQVEEAIEKLNQYYLESDRAFEIIEVNSAYQIMTLPGYAYYLRPVMKDTGDGKRKLSSAALDTLAIVAYKQPVMRVDIDTIRGVNCGPTLRHLIELGFVKVTGRNKEVLGQPMLYGTTEHFLETFGLASIEDLPSVEELRQP